MKQIDSGKFTIADIVVRDRLRPIDQNWVAALAKMIEASSLQHPVALVAMPDGVLRLAAGAHRLAALKLLGWSTAPGNVFQPQTDNPELELRLLEVTENIGRRELSALDRAAHIAELDRTYKQLYPDSRRGVAGAKARHNNASAAFAVADAIADKIGIGKRSVYAAIALHNGLEPTVREALRNTELANKQAQLTQLSKLAPDLQNTVLQHLTGKRRKAANVADALSIIHHKVDPKTPNRAQYDRLVKAWANAGKKPRSWFLDTLMERGYLHREPK